MTAIKEILKTEATNSGYLYMYHDGVFWKAYQRSAYMFIMHCGIGHMTEYRYIKSVARNVLSVGIPFSSFDECFDNADIQNVSNDCVKIKVDGFRFDDYLEWFLSMKRMNVVTNETDIHDEIIQAISSMLSNFDETTATLHDCVRMIGKIRNILNEQQTTIPFIVQKTTDEI